MPKAPLHTHLAPDCVVKELHVPPHDVHPAQLCICTTRHTTLGRWIQQRPIAPKPHLWALVAAMAKEKDLLIVCRLVPILLLTQPCFQPLHQLYSAKVGGHVEQPAVQGKLALLLGKPAAGSSKLRTNIWVWRWPCPMIKDQHAGKLTGGVWGFLQSLHHNVNMHTLTTVVTCRGQQ